MNEPDLLFEAIFQQAPIGIALSHNIDPLDLKKNKVMTYINPKYEEITGRSEEELIRLGWADITHPDDLEENRRKYLQLKSGKIKGYSMEKRFIRPDNSIVWVYLVVYSLFLMRSNKHSHISLIVDISDRKMIEDALTESERSKSVLLSHLPGLAYRCKYDRDWTMLYVSNGCYDLTGYPADSLLYNKEIAFNDIIAPEYHSHLYKNWEYILERKLPFRYEYEIITAKDERKWVLEMGQGIYNENGEIEALEGIILDISDKKEIEDKLRYTNEHDRLTGLHNMEFLEGFLNRELKEKNYTKSAIISINLTPMQKLALTYGFQYVQDLIKKVSESLILLCTNNLFLFKTYENSFLFYVKDYQDKNELDKFCDDIINTLENLLAIERVGGGIGLVEIDKNSELDVDQLMKKLLIASETALNTHNGDFGICYYDEEMEAQITREESIVSQLTQIARDSEDNGLFLQFQPIMDLKTQSICGFEALARLKTYQLGLVSPLEFIPIAEKTKLIIPIGNKIFRKAFSFLKRLEENGYDKIYISVNVSVIQLLRQDFTENLLKIVDDMGVDPHKISLELTESVFISNFDEINDIISKLRDSGFKIYIDDFGKGYSSLAREDELNVNCLKIDKYFMDRLLIKKQNAIASDIVSMAHKLGHCTIAEGVELEEQRQYLIDCGCDMIQGYLISRPLDEEAAIEFLNKES